MPLRPPNLLLHLGSLAVVGPPALPSVASRIGERSLKMERCFFKLGGRKFKKGNGMKVENKLTGLGVENATKKNKRKLDTTRSTCDLPQCITLGATKKNMILRVF